MQGDVEGEPFEGFEHPLASVWEVESHLGTHVEIASYAARKFQRLCGVCSDLRRHTVAIGCGW
jgi:hypothetical protein